MSSSSPSMMEKLKQFAGLSQDSKRRTIFLENHGEVDYHYEEISISQDDLRQVEHEVEPGCTRCKQIEFHQKLRDKEIMLHQYKMKLDQVLIDIHDERMALENEWHALYQHQEKAGLKAAIALGTAATEQQCIRSQVKRNEEENAGLMTGELIDHGASKTETDRSRPNVVPSEVYLKSGTRKQSMAANHEQLKKSNSVSEAENARTENDKSCVEARERSKQNKLKKISAVVRAVVQLNGMQPVCRPGAAPVDVEPPIPEPVHEPEPEPVFVQPKQDQRRRTTIRMLSERSFEGYGAERKQARRKSTMKVNNLLRQTLKAQLGEINSAAVQEEPIITPPTDSADDKSTDAATEIAMISSSTTPKRFSICNTRPVPNLELPQTYVSECQSIVNDVPVVLPVDTEAPISVQASSLSCLVSYSYGAILEMENMEPNEQPLNAATMDEEKAYTMDEVLHEEEKLVGDANAIFGDADSNSCMFNMGYTRQAVYACLTCTSEPAGICIGCSLHCHDGHELIELYSKRNFQCDCGNGKFSSKCRLTADKPEFNVKNQYNQNFKGLYCNCSRPYPDPERTTPESMLQCIICEDWYHEHHLQALNYVLQSSSGSTIRIPDEDEFEEVVCGQCMLQHEFLRLYEDLPIEVVKTAEEQEEKKSVVVECKLKEIEQKQPSDLIEKKRGLPAFMKESWRQSLCDCTSCSTMYLTRDLSFLKDKDDPLRAYEAKAQLKTANDALSASAEAFEKKLTHSQKVEMAIGYRDMSTRLNEYLRGFAERKQVVTKDDIVEFFEELSNKRQKIRK